MMNIFKRWVSGILRRLDCRGAGVDVGLVGRFVRTREGVDGDGGVVYRDGGVGADFV